MGAAVAPNFRCKKRPQHWAAGSIRYPVTELVEVRIFGFDKLSHRPSLSGASTSSATGKPFKNGSSNSGLLSSFSANLVSITPNLVVFNTDKKRWEVSFSTNNYGGFWLKSAPKEPLSIANLMDDKATNLSYGPNPTRQKINIQSATAIEHYTVHNLAGELMMQHSHQGTELALDLSTLIPGTYLVVISRNGQLSTI
jgi:Secretion system C-terminal sorting domain